MGSGRDLVLGAEHPSFGARLVNGCEIMDKDCPAFILYFGLGCFLDGVEG